MPIKAIICDEFGPWQNLRLGTVHRPFLNPNEVRIQVHYAGIGHALGLFVAGKYQRKPPLPFVPGTEVAGVVLEVGDKVQDVTPGQRVVAALDWGGFAEEAVIEEYTVYPLIDELPLQLGAALAITYPTVYEALFHRAQLKQGETVLINGASGALGMAAIQIAKALGATVIASASTPEKRAYALQNQADYTIDSTNLDFKQQIHTLTNDQGVDVVFDVVGGEVFKQSLRASKHFGRVLILGFASGEIPTLAMNLLLLKNLQIIGVNYGYYLGWGLTDERKASYHQVKQYVSEVQQLINPNTIKIDVYPVQEWREGIANTLDRQTIGKAVLQFKEE